MSSSYGIKSGVPKDENRIKIIREKKEEPKVRIVIQRGLGKDIYNDVFTIFDKTGKEVHTAIVHAEMFMKAEEADDFTLPAGEYDVKLTSSKSYTEVLQITSDTVIRPDTGEKGIPKTTKHLIHPNEITKENEKIRREKEESKFDHGPWKNPQSRGCIIFKNKAEFDKMWNKLLGLGLKIGNTIPMTLKDPDPYKREHYR